MRHAPKEVTPREGYGEACHGEHAILPRPLHHRPRVEVPALGRTVTTIRWPTRLSLSKDTGHERKLEERVVQVAAAVLVRPYKGQGSQRPADDGVERDFCNYGTSDRLPRLCVSNIASMAWGAALMAWRIDT